MIYIHDLDRDMSHAWKFVTPFISGARLSTTSPLLRSTDDVVDACHRIAIWSHTGLACTEFSCRRPMNRPGTIVGVCPVATGFVVRGIPHDGLMREQQLSHTIATTTTSNNERP